MAQNQTSKHAESLLALFNDQNQQEPTSTPSVTIQMDETNQSTMRSLYDENISVYLTGRSWDPSRTIPQQSQHERHQQTISGVFIPILQSVVGVLLLIRLPWIIGWAGVYGTLLIILMSVTLQVLTVISMSAICTNGTIQSGGVYFMISRSLGKEYGTSSGLLLFIAISIGCGLYVLAVAEVLLQLAPQLEQSDNNRRLYGTILLIGSIVLTAVVNQNPREIKVKYLRFMSQTLVQNVFIVVSGLGFLAIIVGLLSSDRLDEPYVSGLSSSTFANNWQPRFDGTDRFGVVNPENVGFIKLFSIFFPVVTGFIIGSNRSGDLKDSTRSIPLGSLTAVGFAASIYIILTVLYGAVVDGELLRTKTSTDSLHFAVAAFPSAQVAYVAIFICGIGQVYQALSGAPKMLSAVVKDDVLRVLRFVKGKRLYYKTLFITYLITQSIVLVGNLNAVAPISTMMFLVCYAFLNMSTALLSFLQHPQWRPKFQTHWALSSTGFLLSLVYMFLINYILAIVILVVVIVLYYYVEFQGAMVEYGSGMYALNVSLAQKRLQYLEKSSDKLKGAVNWRPQVIAFVEVDGQCKVTNDQLLPFISQLRKAGGLTILATTIQGSIQDSKVMYQEAKDALKVIMKRYDITGFSKVLVAQDVTEAKMLALQSVGVGALKPNTVVLSYPDFHDRRDMYKFIKAIVALDLAIILQKEGTSKFPENFVVPFSSSNTIDVYWITHDGGILTLLPYLLQKHRMWRKCQLRIYCVAQDDGPLDIDQVKTDLRLLLAKFRIEAESDVIELDTNEDISEFTYEKTLNVKQRSELLQGIHTSEQDLLLHPGQVVRRRTLHNKKQKTEFIKTSIRLNQIITRRSQEAALIFCSLPTPSRDQNADEYFQYIDTLTQGLPTTILVKGSGMEVVTAYF